MPEDTCTKFGFAEFVSKLLSSKKINELIKKKKKKLCVNMFILWIKGKKKVFLFSFLRVYFAEVGSMSMVIKCNVVDTMFFCFCFLLFVFCFFFLRTN